MKVYVVNHCLHWEAPDTEIYATSELARIRTAQLLLEYPDTHYSVWFDEVEVRDSLYGK